MKKTISPLPDDPRRPFSHLEPLIDALLEDGNELIKGSKFYLDRDGWRSDLKYPINFQILKDKFVIPSSILLSEEHDSILCKNTWIEIKGGAVKRK